MVICYSLIAYGILSILLAVKNRSHRQESALMVIGYSHKD